MKGWQIEIIKSMVSNTSTTKIASLIGVTPTGVRSWCKRNGVNYFKDKSRKKIIFEQSFEKTIYDLKTIGLIERSNKYKRYVNKIPPINGLYGSQARFLAPLIEMQGHATLIIQGTWETPRILYSWPMILKNLKSNLTEDIKIMVRLMAKLQVWVHGTNDVEHSLEEVLNELRKSNSNIAKRRKHKTNIRSKNSSSKT